MHCSKNTIIDCWYNLQEYSFYRSNGVGMKCIVLSGVLLVLHGAAHGASSSKYLELQDKMLSLRSAKNQHELQDLESRQVALDATIKKLALQKMGLDAEQLRSHVARFCGSINAAHAVRLSRVMDALRHSAAKKNYTSELELLCNEHKKLLAMSCRAHNKLVEELSVLYTLTASSDALIEAFDAKIKKTESKFKLFMHLGTILDWDFEVLYARICLD